MSLFGKIFRPKKSPQASFYEHLQLIIEQQAIQLTFDIGANKGQFASEIFNCGYGGRLVSFEPGSLAHDQLVAAAKGNPRWTVAPAMALGRAKGTLQLHSFDRTDMNSLYAPDQAVFSSFPKLQAVASETVGVERLDDVADHFIDGETKIFLKIDTQGGERAILDGAAAFLDRVVMLQLEVPLAGLYDGAPTWMDILQPVHERGFRPVLVSPGYFSKRILRQLDFDIVFLRQA